MKKRRLISCLLLLFTGAGFAQNRVEQDSLLAVLHVVDLADVMLE